ncbi:MAG: hypothetical protein AMK75_02625 [Planctomycetes bacterium SM23_65]|nr:MAG: hypothetical protein AMK75_02625 [Planctomycetes bacterium SM23_65]
MSNFSASENNNPTIEELRMEYRALRRHSGLTPETFNERVGAHMFVCEIPKTPEGWVEGAKKYVAALEAEWAEQAAAARGEREYGDDDYEGYMGTGMSEADYYRAAGSAE